MFEHKKGGQLCKFMHRKLHVEVLQPIKNMHSSFDTGMTLREWSNLTRAPFLLQRKYSFNNRLAKIQFRKNKPLVKA